MKTQAWLKTTKAQKQAWMLAEQGSFEDSGEARYHVYNEIKGSYWASLYIDEKRLPLIVNSFTLSTFQDQNPKMWNKLATPLAEICKEFGRDDLAAQIEASRI